MDIDITTTPMINIVSLSLCFILYNSSVESLGLFNDTTPTRNKTNPNIVVKKQNKYKNSLNVFGKQFIINDYTLIN